MLIDLFLVAVLGAALAWTQREPRWKQALAARGSALTHFGRTLLRSHLGHLLVLFALSASLQWASQAAISGWRSLNPEAATGEVSEEARCHAWQQRITREGPEAFAPSELACPAGGGPYERKAAGVSCPVHGEAK